MQMIYLLIKQERLFAMMINNKQTALLIIMDSIDARCENIAILYKYDDKIQNTITIESMENISNIIKDITDNYNDNLYNKTNKVKILSLVPFTDGYNDCDPDTTLFYGEIIEGLKQNMIGDD